MLAYDEVQKHRSADDCWVIINGIVYDLTDFIKNHPGGVKAILDNAGRDATKLFREIHPPNALMSLDSSSRLGPVDPSTIPYLEEVLSPEELLRQAAREEMPVAENIFLLQDFEDWGQRVLSSTAWNYYRSAADEERTFDENRNAYRRYFLRPRILRDVTKGDISTSFVGIPMSLPVVIAPAAMAKLGHPLGEINLTRAAGRWGAIQVISSNASCSVEEMFEARNEGQHLIFQLYLNKDRKASAALIQKVERLGASAIMFTVDVCWDSKRTRDVRGKSSGTSRTTSDTKSISSKAPQGGVAAAIGGYQDRHLTVNDIAFIRANTSLPIIVKGVQSVEDVQLCVDHGVEGVVLSNHGGRQADYSPAPIDILYEMRCLRPDLFTKIDVMVDGGIRCGADVVKALALGAKSVGLGRPILYANGTHGEEGVSRVFEIIQEEIVNTMRNCGTPSLKDLTPQMVGPAGPWVGSNRPPYMPFPDVDQA
ncbi:mitochondrial fmn-dependent dehydrogenase [Meredithblackwellia eburnea MCA 4105]